LKDSRLSIVLHVFKDLFTLCHNEKQSSVYIYIHHKHTPFLPISFSFYLAKLIFLENIFQNYLHPNKETHFFSPKL